MASAPARAGLTQWLKDLLTSAELLVGLVIEPAAGGWDDDPQKAGSKYVGFQVLTPMDSLPPSGSIGDPATEWQFPYSLESVSVDVFGVEDQADMARKIVNEIGRPIVLLGGVNWKIMSARISSIGSVAVNRQVTPRVFSQRDVLMVRITKETP